MRRFAFLLWLGIGFVMGGAAGWWVTRHQYERWAMSFVGAGALPKLGNTFSLLTALRSGDTNEAIDTLEMELNDAVIHLKMVMGHERDEGMKAAYGRALKRVADYRAKYPYKSGSAEIDGAVSETLSPSTNRTREMPQNGR